MGFVPESVPAMGPVAPPEIAQLGRTLLLEYMINTENFPGMLPGLQHGVTQKALAGTGSQKVSK